MTRTANPSPCSYDSSEIVIEQIDPAVLDPVHSGEFHHLTDL